MERTFNCSMCYYTSVTRTRLVGHYVRCHRFDPRFSVRCNFPGCASTYNKWDSYKKHVHRIHRVRDNANEEGDDDDIDHDELNRNIELDEHDHIDDQQQILPRPERLQMEAAKFLLHVKDFCKTSHTAMLKVMEGSQQLISQYINIILEEIRDFIEPQAENMISVEELMRILENTFPPAFLFQRINTKSSLNKFLVDHLGMILPTELPMGETLVWRRGPNLVPKTHKGYQIPFLPNLKRLLLNKDVRQCVDNPRVSDDDILRTVLDGKYYKTHEFFSANANSLAIILYYDEVEVTNALSSKVHKIGMFYWSLANIYPEYRSTYNAINLLAVVKYADIAKFGINKALENFVQDIITFQTDGITVPIQGQGDRVYKGSLLMVTADTPAAALMGGFKKSVSASKPCRRCMAGQHTLRRFFTELEFVLRNMQTHQEHADVVSDEGMLAVNKKFWQKFYGVNERSSLMDIPLFDILKCLVQDIMHILSEGVVEVATREFIKWCVQANHFNLDTLNDRILRFNYGHLQKDKPSPIQSQHLDNKLKQSASQMVCLAHTLPFLVCDLINFENGEDEVEGEEGEEENAADARLKCHVRLLQICNICFAFEISKDDAVFLRRLIKEYCLIYTELYPNTIVPKFHFLIHLPTQIEEFGPARQHWCMRFEAVHAWFKGIAKVVRNFKNVPWTFASRYESMRCFQLAPTEGGMSPKFLYKGHFIKEGQIVNINNIPEQNLLLERLQDFAPGNNVLRIMDSPSVEIHGTRFAVNGFIMLACNEDSLPEFGKIVKVYICDGIDQFFFIIQAYRTVQYVYQLNAYRIVPLDEPNPSQLVISSDLIHPHPLSVYYFPRAKYICLFNHARSEFLL